MMRAPGKDKMGNALKFMLRPLVRAIRRIILPQDMQVGLAAGSLARNEQRLTQVGEQLSEIRQQVDKIKHDLLSPQMRARPWGFQPYFEAPNYWEPTVQLALRDLIRPGSTVFDIGGNFGGLTILMSRLTGPKGAVLAFEASPRIIGILQGNVVTEGLSNVQVFHNAVYSRSHDKIPIFSGSHLNDNIFKSETGDARAIGEVFSVAIDDVVERMGLAPDLIKIDIEGAEFDALTGAAKTLERCKPHLLIEQSADDDRCVHLLAGHGYQSIDLSTYQIIQGKGDYPAKAAVRNLLAVHRSRGAEVPYGLPPRLEPVQSLAARDFHRNGNGIHSVPVDLQPGRYVAVLEFEARGTDNHLYAGVRIGDKLVFRYEANSKWLADSYREWAFDVLKPGRIEFVFEFQNNTSDPTLRVQGVELSRLIGVAPNSFSYLIVP